MISDNMILLSAVRRARGRVTVAPGHRSDRTVTDSVTARPSGGHRVSRDSLSLGGWPAWRHRARLRLPGWLSGSLGATDSEHLPPHWHHGNSEFWQARFICDRD